MLVAEDNKVSQVVVTKLLEKLGCRVDAVGDGRAAVDALRRSAYQLVLMDVQMPEMISKPASAASPLPRWRLPQSEPAPRCRRERPGDYSEQRRENPV